jgi:recombination protein RecT
MTEQKAEIAKKDPTITDLVLTRVTEYQRTGGLRLPSDYAPENALKAAYLILQEVKTREGKPALEACSKVSIANSLFDMVVRGLNPIKKQCYFIPYGTKLQLSPSYFGNIATAKRVGMKNIVANVVYADDVFEYAVDPNTGRIKVTKHEQKVQNIDSDKIIAAYAVAEFDGGIFNATIMTIKEVKQSWLQGAAKGNSGAHQNFGAEMAKKTVINKACKIIINSSDDGYLGEPLTHEETNEAATDANQGFVDFEEVKDEAQAPEEKKPDTKKPEEKPAEQPKAAPTTADGKAVETKMDF